MYPNIRNTLFICVSLLLCKPSFAQKATVVEPKGIYAEIDLTEQNKMMERLIDDQTRKAAVDTIFNNIKHYNPPVIYFFAYIIYTAGEKQSGLEWYLYARLNAMYDANRCADTTAQQALLVLEKQFSPYFNTYIQNNKVVYTEAIKKVVALFEHTKPDYDYRWINLNGMDAIISSSEENPQPPKPLSLPKESWPQIKTQTIKAFKELNSEK